MLGRHQDTFQAPSRVWGGLTLTKDDPQHGIATVALSIHSNSLSLSAQRSLDKHATAQAKLTERLGSALRIERAADDPAGQAIVSRMASSLRTMNMGRCRNGSSKARPN